MRNVQNNAKWLRVCCKHELVKHNLRMDCRTIMEYLGVGFPHHMRRRLLPQQGCSELTSIRCKYAFFALRRPPEFATRIPSMSIRTYTQYLAFYQSSSLSLWVLERVYIYVCVYTHIHTRTHTDVQYADKSARARIHLIAHLNTHICMRTMHVHNATTLVPTRRRP